MSSQTLLWLKPVAWGDSLIPRGEPIQTLGKVILHFTSPSLPKWLPRFTEHALPSLRTVAPLALQAQLNNNNAVSSRPQIIARVEIATNFYWYTNNRSKLFPPPKKISFSKIYIMRITMFKLLKSVELLLASGFVNCILCSMRDRQGLITQPGSYELEEREKNDPAQSAGHCLLKFNHWF